MNNNAHNIELKTLKNPTKIRGGEMSTTHTMTGA